MIATPILTVVFSAAVSWFIARYAAYEVLKGEIGQGQAVFEDIGYRYFHAVYELYDKKSFTLRTDGKPGNSIEKFLLIYRKIFVGSERITSMTGFKMM